MAHLDHDPTAEDLRVVTNVELFGESREVARAVPLAELSNDAQAALNLILAALDALLPQPTAPITVRRTITTVTHPDDFAPVLDGGLWYDAPQHRLARAYYVLEVEGFDARKEGEVAIEAYTASPELLAAWRTLADEVLDAEVGA